MNDVEAMQRAFHLYLHFKKKVEAKQYAALIRLPAQQEPKRRAGGGVGHSQTTPGHKHNEARERERERDSLANQLANSGHVKITD